MSTLTIVLELNPNLVLFDANTKWSKDAAELRQIERATETLITALSSLPLPHHCEVCCLLSVSCDTHTRILECHARDKITSFRSIAHSCVLIWGRYKFTHIQTEFEHTIVIC